jgi:hypothetical protein
VALVGVAVGFLFAQFQRHWSGQLNPSLSAQAAQAAQQSPQTALTVPREVLVGTLLLGLWLPAPVAGGHKFQHRRVVK